MNTYDIYIEYTPKLWHKIRKSCCGSSARHKLLLEPPDTWALLSPVIIHDIMIIENYVHDCIFIYMIVQADINIIQYPWHKDAS